VHLDAHATGEELPLMHLWSGRSRDVWLKQRSRLDNLRSNKLCRYNRKLFCLPRFVDTRVNSKVNFTWREGDHDLRKYHIMTRTLPWATGNAAKPAPSPTFIAERQQPQTKRKIPEEQSTTSSPHKQRYGLRKLAYMSCSPEHIDWDKSANTIDLSSTGATCARVSSIS
jgi:hypothetical protein